MIRRHVERLEVVEVVLDLRPFEDLVAHVREDVLDLPAHAHQGVDAPDRQLAAGKRDVEPRGRRPRRFERLALLAERRLDFGLEGVDELTEFSDARRWARVPSVFIRPVTDPDLRLRNSS
jgi:hypothetical protein